MAYKTQFDDGLELAQYHANIEDYDDGKQTVLQSPGGKSVICEYGGMEVHQYGGGTRAVSTGSSIPEDASEKLPINSRKYEENSRSRLRRDLKTRQISMIAIGGALGTGLLINT
jgi:amino acid transporter